MVMVFTYAKVYKAAIEHTKSLRLGAKQLRSAMGGSNGVVLRMHRGGGASRRVCASPSISAASVSGGSARYVGKPKYFK